MLSASHCGLVVQIMNNDRHILELGKPILCVSLTYESNVSLFWFSLWNACFCSINIVPFHSIFTSLLLSSTDSSAFSFFFVLLFLNLAFIAQNPLLCFV